MDKMINSKKIGGEVKPQDNMKNQSITKFFLSVILTLSLIIVSFSTEIMAQNKTSGKKKTTSTARSASGKNGTKAKKSSTARSASGRNGTKAKKSSSTKSTSSAARSASGKSGIWFWW